MTATIRYYLAATIHGQRFLGPLLLYATVLSVFTINDTGPLVGSYVVSAGGLLLTMCWLTVIIVNLEEPARRAITTVTAGSAGRVVAGLVGFALLAGVALIAVGTVFPILSGEHVVSPGAVAAGVLAQGVTVCTGVAVGLLCSRLVVPRPGYSLVLALLVIIVVPLTPGLPPVNPMLRAMSRDSASLPLLTAQLGIAIVVLAAAVALTHSIAVRRE